MGKTAILAAIAAMAIPLTAIADGEITSQMLEQYRQDTKVDPASKAARNAMAFTPVNTLATDISNLTPVNGDFSHRVPTKGITNQRSSGRCWLFSGLNVLRAKAIMNSSLPELEFSQCYIFFYDQLEKANLFLQGIIDTRQKPMDDRMVDWLFRNPVSDGGTFTGVADLVMKYGVVPKEAMPETYIANNTSQFNSLLKLKLREMGLQLRDLSDSGASTQQLEAQKTEMLGTIYDMLTLAYGIPPTEFQWTIHDKEGKAVTTDTYTPQSFYEGFGGGEDLCADYIMLMDDPTRDYYKVYQIDYDRHTYDGHDWLYLNLPVAEIKPLAIESIKDSTAMYFSCDVGKFLDRKKGTCDLANYDYEALLGVTFGMDKRQRVLTHASGSSHALTLIAVNITDDGTPDRWMVENSWGADSGYKGNLVMTDEWFDEYMFRLVLNKKYVPGTYLKMLEQTPILLPAWDPMFAPEQ